jgi:salicylate biosynthesis isochorismate synthase/menaquinone-specific isochorismate synthase
MHADTGRRASLYQAALARAAHLERPVLVSTTERTHRRDPITVFAEASYARDRALWLCPQTGEALVGVGAAQTLTAEGARRFQRIASAWHTLLADALLESGAAGAASPPRGPLLLGGFSFDDQPPTGLWRDFGAARFVLPEQLLSLRGGLGWLTASSVLTPGGAPEEDPEAAEQLAPTVRGGLTAEAWQNLVGDVARGIRRDRLGVRKVVLARALEVEPRRSLESALRLLAEQYPTCTVFAVAHADSCFLGATPERLISLRDGAAVTMALAGSAPRGDTAAEDDALAQHLLSDPKERGEHELVVDALREALEPVCGSVVADAQPRVQKLSNLQHLLTPICAQVSSDRGVLDLVERIHPTPAVGGVPRARSLELIREREALDRGWYAGPIGWVDGRGEGEFVVGLRSALLRGHMATLFAGCGIVAESNPETEYAEWGWKLRPMLNALGAEA